MRPRFISLILLVCCTPLVAEDSSSEQQARSPRLSFSDILNFTLSKHREEAKYDRQGFFEEFATRIANGQHSFFDAATTIAWQYPFKRIVEFEVEDDNKTSKQYFMERVDLKWVKSSFHSSLEHRDAYLLHLKRGGIFYILPANDDTDAIALAQQLCEHGMAFRGAERKDKPTQFLLPYGGSNTLAFFSQQGVSESNQQQPKDLPPGKLQDSAVALPRFIWLAENYGRIFAAGYVTN